MNGKVIKLCDIDSIEIPEEMLKVEIEPDFAENALKLLSLRYGKTADEEKVESGDTVYCKADEESYPDKRKILLFVSTGVAGAEKAESDVLGKVIGETVETEILEKKVKLTIEKIVRHIPAEISDDLISSMKIEGVNSVDKYKSYIVAKKLDSLKTEKIKAINYFLLTTLAENSVFEYDEKEMDECAEKAADEAFELYSPEELGETRDELKLEYIASKKQAWTARAFCQSREIEPDMAEIEEEADQMLEMMSLMGEELPDREEMIEQSMENAYYGEFFNFIEKEMNERIGG